MALIQFPTADDISIGGSLSVVTAFYPPALSIKNSHISTATADRIDAYKTIDNRSVFAELYGPATLCAALSKDIYIAHGPGTLLSFSAFIEVTGTAGDKVVTVDLHKSTAAGAWATVLSATISFAAAAAVRTLVSGTLSSTAYLAGDLFRAVVTVAGTTGAYAQGLNVRLCADESYS